MIVTAVEIKSADGILLSFDVPMTGKIIPMNILSFYCLVDSELDI